MLRLVDDTSLYFLTLRATLRQKFRWSTQYTMGHGVQLQAIAIVSRMVLWMVTLGNVGKQWHLAWLNFTQTVSISLP